jgi:hypothetical protein
MVSRFWRAGGTALAPGGFEAAGAEEGEGPDYGPDLLLGAGDFSSDAAWSLTGSSPPVIAGGTLIAAGEGYAAYTLAEATGIRAFQIDFEIVSISSGDVTCAVGGNGGATAFSAPGAKSLRIVSGGGQVFAIGFGSGCDAVIDNVTLRQPLSLGPELCTNGDFSSAAGWTLTGAGAAIAGGVYSASAAPALRRASRPADATLVALECYRVALTIANRTAGVGTVIVGGVSIANIGGNGTYIRDVQTSAADQNIIAQIGFNAALDQDDISVRKIL